MAQLVYRVPPIGRSPLLCQDAPVPLEIHCAVCGYQHLVSRGEGIWNEKILQCTKVKVRSIWAATLKHEGKLTYYKWHKNQGWCLKPVIWQCLYQGETTHSRTFFWNWGIGSSLPTGYCCPAARATFGCTWPQCGPAHLWWLKCAMQF